MKNGKWFVVCTLIVFCVFFATVCLAGPSPKQDSKVSENVAPASFVRAEMKSMTGKVKSFDPKKNSFQFTPNNVGLPIEITCKEKSSGCDVSALIAGLDASVKAYYEKEKWWAVSVERKK